jgi:hypothetical protein
LANANYNINLNVSSGLDDRSIADLYYKDHIRNDHIRNSYTKYDTHHFATMAPDLDYRRITDEISLIDHHYRGQSPDRVRELVGMIVYFGGENSLNRYVDLFHQAMERLEDLLQGTIPDDDVHYLMTEWQRDIRASH